MTACESLAIYLLLMATICIGAVYMGQNLGLISKIYGTQNIVIRLYADVSEVNFYPIICSLSSVTYIRGSQPFLNTVPLIKKLKPAVPLLKNCKVNNHIHREGWSAQYSLKGFAYPSLRTPDLYECLGSSSQNLTVGQPGIYFGWVGSGNMNPQKDRVWPSP